MTDWKRWLSRARITDNPIGDLIADMRRDRKAPASFAGIRDLRSYLARGSASKAAVDGMWRRFKLWQQEERRRRS